MNSLKKLAVGLTTAALVLGAAMPVFAVTETSNKNILDHSYAVSSAFDNDTLKVENKTEGVKFENWDVALGVSGFVFENDAEDENTVETAGAGAEYETANFVNVGETKSAESTGAKASNDTVSDHSGDPCGSTCSCCDGCSCGGTCGGPCLDPSQCPTPCACPAACPVTAIAEDNDNFAVDNTNKDTDVFNVTASVAVSGVVFLNDVEDLNKVTTGVSISGAYVANVVNNNYSELGGGGGPTEAKNKNILDHSYAVSEAYDNDTVKVTNVNENTDVENVTAAVAISGLVGITNAEDGNEVTTNQSAAETTTENYVNVNETKVAVDSGTKATNEDLDDHSSAKSVAEDNDNVTVSNTNKDTTVKNISVAGAISGGVSLHCVEDGNKVKTGVAVATGTTMNVVNGNQTTVE